MMRGILFGLTVVCWLFSSLLYAQNEVEKAIINDIAAKLKVSKIQTPESEVEDVIVHLLSVPEEDRPFYRYFTVYAVPPNLREDVWLQLSFTCHSLMGQSLTDEGNAGGFYPIAIRDTAKLEDNFQLFNKVSDTIVWIDIRNFNWTPQSWELMSQEDGYFVEPIIDYQKNGALRLLAGNALIRADWFIRHATDITTQEDRAGKTAIYNALLYAKVKEPKTTQEFETIWGLPNKEESRRIGNEYLTITLNEEKTVARHNRILAGYRTQIGWLYRTYDVKSETGLRDYVESFHEWGGKPPKVFDGGEMFATNQVQMQVYTLFGADEKLVSFADPSLARHMSDVLGDARVRTPTSCIDCHAAGPIPSQNIIKEYIKARGLYGQYNKDDQIRVERAYLSDKFEDSIIDNQLVFARSLKKINGLLPEENAKSYLKIIDWYQSSLDLNQILFECGVTKEEFVEKTGIGSDEHIKRRVPGRLSVLINNGYKIPRESWESPGRDGYPGIFQQTMILLHGLTAIEYNYVVIDQPKNLSAFVMENGKGVWYNNITAGQKFEYTGEIYNNDWYVVNNNGTKLYISKTISRLIND